MRCGSSDQQGNGFDSTDNYRLPTTVLDPRKQGMESAVADFTTLFYSRIFHTSNKAVLILYHLAWHYYLSRMLWTLVEVLHQKVPWIACGLGQMRVGMCY